MTAREAEIGRAGSLACILWEPCDRGKLGLACVIKLSCCLQHATGWAAQHAHSSLNWQHIMFVAKLTSDMVQSARLGWFEMTAQHVFAAPASDRVQCSCFAMRGKLAQQPDGLHSNTSCLCGLGCALKHAHVLYICLTAASCNL